ncbi:Sesquiterpene synthase Agr8 [Psilocybe cubensis]|uniref:Sesquiterpene synthase Agr8 n=2 Tax=Psilocybe cubensis TaxID=181762 RepID=A0ACB8GLR2_PSICU|nr:Sesquiterpene synthase Agr8 [Psilocybe cubensis]KAH9476332.1 Sesquiterpene synthase Agr8 [Psilocybe cubensis]
MTRQYFIPDLLATWPWPRSINASLSEVEEEANAWVQSLELFDPSQFKKFKACNFNLLGALIGPLRSKDHLRISCDLMNFYFAFDEYTDLANREEALQISKDVMDAFRDTSKPSDSKLIEMARQFFQRTVDVVGDDRPGFERFIADFDAYTTSIIQEADDRSVGHVRSVEDYLILRRDTCGAKPSFSFYALGLNLPNDVFDNSLVASMLEAATDLIAITNDMHSYGLEHSRGLDGHNVVTAIMKEYNLDLQEALYWLSGYATKTISKFNSDRRKLPSWGPEVDAGVHEFFDLVGRCVRGYDAWSYETKRYYGDKGMLIQKTRKITLQPRDAAYITREQLKVSITA